MRLRPRDAGDLLEVENGHVHRGDGRGRRRPNARPSDAPRRRLASRAVASAGRAPQPRTRVTGTTRSKRSSSGSTSSNAALAARTGRHDAAASYTTLSGPRARVDHEHVGCAKTPGTSQRGTASWRRRRRRVDDEPLELELVASISVSAPCRLDLRRRRARRRAEDRLESLGRRVAAQHERAQRAVGRGVGDARNCEVDPWPIASACRTRGNERRSTETNGRRQPAPPPGRARGLSGGCTRARAAPERPHQRRGKHSRRAGPWARGRRPAAAGARGRAPRRTSPRAAPASSAERCT